MASDEPAASRPTPVPVQIALRDIGHDLATWRRLRGLTAAQVAERAGITRVTLRNIESGKGTVSLENTFRVARALGILDSLAKASDPYATDVGRLRSEEILPERVRRPRRGDSSG
jgi:transcriptional regulator with XRE-family HTH domain